MTTAKIPPVMYNVGTPPSNGTYAVRLPMLEAPDILEDIFLFWDKGTWYYPLSAQSCRREVKYWIGPLQRRLPL